MPGYCWYITQCCNTMVNRYILQFVTYYWYYTHLYIHPIIGIIPTCIFTLLLVLYPFVYLPYCRYHIPICIFTLLLVLYPLVYSLICNHLGNKYHTSCCNLSFIFIPIAIIIFVMPSGIVFPILTIM